MKTMLLTIVFLVAIVLGVLPLPPMSDAQITCFQYGTMTSCDGPRGQHFEQWQYNRDQGVIVDSQGRVEPYAILPPRQEPSKSPYGTQPSQPSFGTPREPVSPYSSFEMPSAPVFLYGTGEAGQ